MKILRILLVFVAIFVVAGVVYNLFSMRNGLQNEAEQLRGEVRVLQEENKELLRDIEYFENKDNLLKELKSQFNYREAGEGIIIIVPEASSTSR